MGTVCFGAFMGQLDASIVTLTYRPVQTEFHAGLAGVEWVSLAYLLVLIALVVPVGRLSDADGRKLVYLYGFVVFTAASAGCGLAPSLGLLVGFRAVQALGAAMLQANSVALVTTSAPRAHWRGALGVQAGAQALGLALGPSLGGILVSTVGWRWVYLINVPVGVIALVSGYFLLPRTRDRSPSTGLDCWGVALLAISATALLLGISTASGLSLPAEITLVLFGLSAWAGWAFVARQRRVAHPLIDMGLLRDPVVSWGLLGAMCGYLVLFGPLVLVPVVLADQGLSAVAAGLALTALPAGFALAALVADRVLPRGLSERKRASLGAALCTAALGVGLFVALTPTTLVPLLALVGVGLGVFTPSNNTLIMGSIPERSAATGGGLLNLSRGLGTALGVALITLALHLGSGQLGIFSGDRLAFFGLLVATALATVASASGLRPVRRCPGQRPSLDTGSPTGTGKLS